MTAKANCTECGILISEVALIEGRCHACDLDNKIETGDFNEN